MSDLTPLTPFLVGIGGGTGAGKTTLANKILEAFGRHRAALISVDSYYKDLNHLPGDKRRQINFDHPEALDQQLLLEHIKALRQGHSIRKALYDFTSHTVTGQHLVIEAKAIIVVEGILVFSLTGLRRLFDMKIYIDEAADIRLLRRLMRDIEERGRSLEAAAAQYLRDVRPMHLRFVEPGKEAADMVLHHGYDTEDVVRVIKETFQNKRGVEI